MTLIVEAITKKASAGIGVERNSMTFPPLYQMNQDAKERRKRQACDNKMFEKCKMCQKGELKEQTDVDYRKAVKI